MLAACSSDPDEAGVGDADDGGDTAGDTAESDTPDDVPVEDAVDDTGEPPETRPTLEDIEAYCGPDFADVESRIDTALSELTLEQKAGLMHGNFPIALDGTWSTDGIDELDIPGFEMLDGPRGLSRFSDRTGTAFPVAMARGATWNPALEREVGAVVGSELRLAGADTLLAPTVNILRHPRWGRAQETYGEDPLHMGIMGEALVLGAQEHVMAVVKHYAANSIEDTRLEVNVVVSERTLREIYLPHFRRIVDAGVAGVMSAYNQVNGEWASEQDHLLGDVLRGEWGFAGFVVSDFLWGTHDTASALDAGLDVEMPEAEIYGEPVEVGVLRRELDEALVDAAVRRILRAQWCFRESTSEPTIDEIESEEALALARRVAREGMVLLENRGDALPIDRSAAPTIALVGTLVDEENTGDRGSSHVESTDVVTMLEGLTEAAGDATIVHVEGDLSADDDRTAVESADVVVAIVGYSEDEEGEGQIAAGDREILSLPADDVGIINAAAALNDRVITVIVGGSSVTMDGWRDEVEAIVMAWYAGAQGGHALAELLYGEANFSGRLPISFAARDEDLPPFDNESLEVDYGYFHGYRHLQNEGSAPLYPFGYGIGYAPFSHANATAELDGEVIRASVDVTNDGSVSGVEVVQLYVGAPGGAVERAPRDLRGFERVELDAGDTATVAFELALDEVRYFDEGSMGWVLEGGDYRIELGANVEATQLAGTVTVP